MRRSRTRKSGQRPDETAPRGYILNHQRLELWTGAATFERAKAAVRHWRMFELGAVSSGPTLRYNLALWSRCWLEWWNGGR